jgi:uncharacterized protein YerC
MDALICCKEKHEVVEYIKNTLSTVRTKLVTADSFNDFIEFIVGDNLPECLVILHKSNSVEKYLTHHCTENELEYLYELYKDLEMIINIQESVAPYNRVRQSAGTVAMRLFEKGYLVERDVIDFPEYTPNY